jgi:hypothetical protein
MQNLCAELKQKVQEEKQRRKTLSREERRHFKACRNEINERVDAEQVRRIDEISRNKEIRDAMKEWADCVLHVWDTRNAPSNIFELEAAAELPYSHKKWLH